LFSSVFRYIFFSKPLQKTCLFHFCKKCSGLFIGTAAVDHLIQNVRSTAAMTRILSAHHFRGFFLQLFWWIFATVANYVSLFSPLILHFLPHIFFFSDLYISSPHFPPSIPLPPPHPPVFLLYPPLFFPRLFPSWEADSLEED
jgi:hypothetical protein